MKEKDQRAPRKCRYCGEVGHYIQTCPKRKADIEAEPPPMSLEQHGMEFQQKNPRKPKHTPMELQREVMTPDLPKLSNRYFLFCENLLRGMKQGEAYLAAGFDCKDTSAPTNASKALKREDVRVYLSLRRKQIMEECECTLEWWVKRNMAIIQEAHDLKETPASRSAAMERIGRYLGAYQKDRTNEADKRSTDELLADLPGALRVLNGGRLTEKDRELISDVKKKLG